MLLSRLLLRPAAAATPAPIQLVLTRDLATQKRDRANKFDKTPEKKKITQAERRAQAQRAEAAKNWNIKSTGEKSKIWFPRFLLQGEQREMALKQVHREPTLWELQVAKRHQLMTSRRHRRMCFALECAFRIRDDAIAQLPAALQQQVVASGKLKRDVPISRRCATWTPPSPQYMDA